MIKILHGENISESRKTLVSLIEKARREGREIIRLEGGKLTLAELRSACETSSLLAQDRLVVVENFFSGLKSKEKTHLGEYLAKEKFDNDLIFWEGKELRKTEIISQAQIEAFKVNPIIFRFLQILKPGRTQEMLQLLREVKETEETSMIFYMMIRQIRLLILANDLGPPGLTGLAPWQQRKILNQARNFTLAQLREIYRKLLEIDFNQKTSGDSYSLSSRLDLFVSSI